MYLGAVVGRKILIVLSLSSLISNIEYEFFNLFIAASTSTYYLYELAYLQIKSILSKLALLFL